MEAYLAEGRSIDITDNGWSCEYQLNTANVTRRMLYIKLRWEMMIEKQLLGSLNDLLDLGYVS